MSNDVSGFGIRVQLVASVTFPQGIPLTQFADDADPLDFPVMTIAATGMGVNGDMTKWATPAVVPVTLNMIANSEDDKNLQALFDANRVSRGRFGAKDKITLTAIYPDGSKKTATDGVIISGPGGRGIASSGRIKTSAYAFNFER